MFFIIMVLTTGGSVSLDSQSPAAPCESSSLATARDDMVRLEFIVFNSGGLSNWHTNVHVSH
jgi:hypothetical protein